MKLNEYPPTDKRCFEYLSNILRRIRVIGFNQERELDVQFRIWHSITRKNK